MADGVTAVKARSPFPTGIFSYSMRAEIPKGASLKIIIKGGIWFYTGVPGPKNWTVDEYNFSMQTQVFTVTESGTPSDLEIFVESGEITIEYYENEATEPTRTKQVIAEVQTQP